MGMLIAESKASQTDFVHHKVASQRLFQQAANYHMPDDVVRRVLHTLILIVFAAAISPTAPPNPYPHELPHFKFYTEYLSPLRPYISELDSVTRVLGSDQGRELPDWRIQPLFVGKGNTLNGRPWAKDITGRLASISIRPKQRVSTLNVKFPKQFTHTFGSVSEVNVSCDVYSDDSGLAYWIYAEDSAVGKNGDLMNIEYGPSAHLKQEIEGSSESDKRR
jgi:hypothetical protein